MQDTQSLIQVNRAVLHILDLNSGVPIFSDTELDREVFELLQKHLEKAWKDPALHDSKISDVNPVYQKLSEYSVDRDQFIPVSKELAKKLHDDLIYCGEENTIDFVAVDFFAAGIQQYGILLYKTKQGYTHKVKQDENQVSNEIIQHYAILPNPGQKADMYAFVDLEEFTVKFFDKKRVLEGEEVFLLPDRLLNCTMPISAKETVKNVHSIVGKVAEEFGESSIMAIARAKAYLLEVGKAENDIEPEDLAEEVFSDHPGMRQSFLEQAELKNLSKSTAADQEFLMKANKTHKIKTDTGIEIIVPSEYMSNPEYIEFVSNDNGTISVNLKNIGELING